MAARQAAPLTAVRNRAAAPTATARPNAISLTTKRCHQTRGGPLVENDTYTEFVRRAIRALGRRAGDDIDALVLLRDLAEDVDVALASAVRRCHDHPVHPWSWTDIAERLGMTRQAARQRWNQPTFPAHPDQQGHRASG